jgi:ribosomal protein S18 acetylase RimI-like enzyme
VGRDDVEFRVADSRVSGRIALLWGQATARSLDLPSPTVADGQFAEKLRARLAGPGAMVVVGERAAEIVACCLATPLRSPCGRTSRAEAHLSLVAVAPQWWGNGYGAAMLAYAEQSLAAAGYRRAELHVQVANTRARRLYERCGWSLLRAGEPHPDGPQVIYGKTLTDPSISPSTASTTDASARWPR